MFGYVTPDVPELKVKEHALYRAVYCGLCRSMGTNVTAASRLSLSYDFVFLALVRLSLSGETVSFSEGRCLAHPFKKRQYAKETPSLAYAAKASGLLTYHKLRDDIADKRFLPSLPSRLLLPAAARMRKKAALPDLDAKISASLASLSALEKGASEDASPDRAAALFGDLLGGIFTEGLTGNEEKIAREIGYHVGKWIYLADAADDLEKDKKTGAFNPFLSEGTDPERLYNAMQLELHAASLAVELIAFPDPSVASIVRNVIYLGMPRRAEQVLKRTAKERNPVTE
ncbi:MAG: DUF5685 family protein [Lachnospiraceae bacterium]|nr:DUF5685 family protein [Lachnospiraceae bacterium]